MANEKRGILFETIAEAALQQAIQLAGIPGVVRWNEQPQGMSIEPDFTIGLDKDNPSHVTLVTASGSAKETDKKFWRNLGELQETKAQLPSTPSTFSLYFKSVVKEGLDYVAERVYDYNFHLEGQPYAQPLEQWVAANLASVTRTKSDKQALLAQAMATNLSLAAAVTSLAQDLAVVLKQRNTDLDPLWQLMRADYLKPHNPPSSKKTSVRRGLGKLLVLDDISRQLVYGGYNKTTKIIPGNLPQYAYDLGFFRKTLGGAVVSDPEIQGVLDLLGAQAVEAVLQQAPQSMSIWINPLRDLGRVLIHVDFVITNYLKFIDGHHLDKLLLQCFNNPSALSGAPGDEKVWIYEIMISLLKAKSKRLQGYGLAQLAEDTGLYETGVGAPLARFIIPKFVQREEILEPQYLSMLAQGLAKRFQQEISLADLPELRKNVVEWVIKENLEDRLIPYRNFEPLLWLLETELKIQGKAYVSKKPYVGWVNEYAGIGKRSATTPFVRVGSTWIHWKSSHASHPNDKTKELSARARSFRYQYDPDSRKFTRRNDVQRLALIVDGDWSDRHLQTLAQSGWDMIVYPDQISQFVSAL